jgi:hypothetical protein
LSVETGINTNVHVVDVVLQLHSSQCSEVISVTGSNQTGVSFAPLSADPPDKRSSGLHVGG